MCGSSSSSPRIAASSSSVTSTSSVCSPACCPASPSPVLRIALADRIAGLAVALARRRPARLSPKRKRGMSICGHRDRDHVLALAADHLAVGDVLPQVLLDLALDDRPETRDLCDIVELMTSVRLESSSGQFSSRTNRSFRSDRHERHRNPFCYPWRFLTSPRAKIEATKFSTSVEQISQ